MYLSYGEAPLSLRGRIGLLIIASILGIIINKEVFDTEVSFLIFRAMALRYIILFLVTVSTNHLAWDFFGPIHIAVLITLIGNIDNVHSGGWGGVLSSLFSVSVMVVLLSLFSSLGVGFFQLLKG